MSRIEQISNILVEKYSLVQADADQFVREMFAVIRETLLVEKQVKVKGLGTFKLTEVNGRASVDVNTGERIHIEGHTKISFTPENSVRDRINAPFSQFESFDLEDGVDFDKIDNKYAEGNTTEEPETAVVADDEQQTAVENALPVAPAPAAEPEPVEEAPVAEEQTSDVDVPVNETAEESLPEEAACEEEIPASDEESPVDYIVEEVAAQAPVEPQYYVEEPQPVEENPETYPSADDAEAVASEVYTETTEAYSETSDVYTEPAEVYNEPVEALPPSDSSEILQEELRRTNTLVKVLLAVVVFLIVCIIAFGAYFYLNHSKHTEPIVETPENVEHIDSATTTDVNEQAVESEYVTEEEQTDKTAEKINPHDFRVVGIEKEIVLDRNMSLKDIAKDNGGSYMRDFIKDANGGRKYFERGDTILIPKLEKRD